MAGIRSGLRMSTSTRLRRVMEHIPERLWDSVIMLAVDAVSLDDLSCMDAILNGWNDPDAEGILLDVEAAVREDLQAINYSFDDDEWGPSDVVISRYTHSDWYMVLREL